MGKDRISLFQMRILVHIFCLRNWDASYTQQLALDFLAAFFSFLMAQIMVHHRYQRHFRFDEMERYFDRKLGKWDTPDRGTGTYGSTEVASLVVRWWRVCLPEQVQWNTGQSLVWGDCTCCNCWGVHGRAGVCDNEKLRPSTREEPCPPHQRRPASSSEGPAQPEAIIKAKQHRGVTRHATLKEQGWI